MKKIIFLAIISIVSFCCSKPSDGEDVRDNRTDSACLMVQGQPFLMLGAQLRTDYFIQLDGKTYDELEPYFELTAKSNVLVVSVPVGWRDIETGKDVYDMSLVEKYIDLCDKYELKLELLWYGSYMCGYSVEGYLPDYVVGDTDTYPELNPGAAYQGWLGKQFYLVPNTPALVVRESKALGEMMKGIYEYDRKNGGKHTVIGIQIENEPDMLATRHNNETGYAPEQIWPDLIDMLDALGRVVKDSEYECYTRVNQTTSYPDYNARSAEICARDGIDYVGVDPYENTLYNIELKLRWLQNIKGNYSHIAENGGEFANNDILMLKALSMGCGYEIFEIVTTPHEYLKDWTLRGIYNPDFTPKAHTANITDAFKIFRDGWVDLACAATKDILDFNTKKDNGEIRTSATKKTANATIAWATEERGVAYAVEYDSHITLASTKADVMDISGITVKSIEKGRYDIGRNWIPSESVRLSGNSLKLEPCSVYRIEF